MGMLQSLKCLIRQSSYIMSSVQTVEGCKQLSQKSCFNEGKQGQIYLGGGGGGMGAEAPPSNHKIISINDNYVYVLSTR